MNFTDAKKFLTTKYTKYTKGRARHSVRAAEVVASSLWLELIGAQRRRYFQ
jgi:hypothetical protein